MNRCPLGLAAAMLVAFSAAAADAPTVQLYAAGSLRAAMSDIAKAYSEAYGVAVTPTFGGSGLLKDRLEKGEPGDVFASADMGNPQALTSAGKSGPTVLFARNHLCAILRPGLKATPASLLSTLLNPSVKVGTSTPISDPAGDYAWALFKKADAVRPGSHATLEAKAVKIGNAPGSLAVPAGVTNGVAWLFKEKRADVFLAYCTAGGAVAVDLPGTTTISLPPALAIEANYGLTILKDANQDRAAQLALFILSPQAQKILAEHGFDAPLLIPPPSAQTGPRFAPCYNRSIRNGRIAGRWMRYTKVATKAESSLGLHLRYAFEPGEQRGATLGNPLFDLLAAVLELGSIRHAAQSMGRSYRYVWGSLRKWEQMLGEPLIIWSQGQRARPTQFAERLLWAERRARTRMQPHIEALRSDLSRVVAEARDPRHQLLTVQASHDMALCVLQQHVADTADLHVEIRFQGSEDALRGLSDRQCLVAGFHVPALRGAAPVFAKALKPLLKPGRHKLIGCSRRMQGLMVRREHAALIRTFPDVVRHGLRFVNRQIGSGTRMLIDHLMHEHSLSPSDLPGYGGLTEETHVAVALCVASGLADAGVGVEAAALEFGLHFAPLVEENYFLACLKGNLGHTGVLRLCAALAGPGWRDILNNLPGYQPALAPGKVLVMTEALPWWPKIKSRPKQRKATLVPSATKVAAEQLV